MFFSIGKSFDFHETNRKYETSLQYCGNILSSVYIEKKETNRYLVSTKAYGTYKQQNYFVAT